MAKQYTEAELLRAIRRAFGDLGEDVVQQMLAISLAENRGMVLDAIGDNYASGHQSADSPARYDYGPFQINSQHGYDAARLTSDLDYNVRAAREIYDRQGPQAWATYNAGLAGEATANVRPAPMRQTQQPQQSGRRPPVPGATLVWSPDMARGGGGSAPTPPLSAVQGEFGGGPITQGFGPTSETLDGPYTDPDTGKTYKHFNKGVDIAMPSGAPVTAFNGGTVVTAGDDGTGWGTRVVVRDDNGFYHSYGHMNTTAVKPGQKVNAGGVLGASGNTGSSTGPHLSYDIYTADGRYYDPAKIAAAAAGGDEMAEPNYWKKRFRRKPRSSGGTGSSSVFGELDESGGGGSDAPETVTDDAGNRYGWDANAVNPDTGEQGDWVLLFPAQAEQSNLTSKVNPATGTMFVIEEDGTQWDTGVSWAEADRVQIPGKGLYERSPETGKYTLVIPEGGDYRPTDMPGVVFDGSTGQYLAPGPGGGLTPLTMAELEALQRKQMGLPYEVENLRARQVLEGGVRHTARAGGVVPDRGDLSSYQNEAQRAARDEAERLGAGQTYRNPTGLMRGMQGQPLPGISEGDAVRMEAAAAAAAGPRGTADPFGALLFRYNPDGSLDLNDPGTRAAVNDMGASGAIPEVGDQLKLEVAKALGQTGLQRFYMEGPSGTSAGVGEPGTIAEMAERRDRPSGFIRNPVGAPNERKFSSLDELKGLLGLGTPVTGPDVYAVSRDGPLPRTDVMAPEAPGAGMAAAPPVAADPYANVFAGGRAGAAADPYANVFAGGRAPAPVLPGITPAPKPNPKPITGKQGVDAAKKIIDDYMNRLLGLV